MQVDPRILGTHTNRLSTYAVVQLVDQPVVTWTFACPYGPDQMKQVPELASG